MTTRAPRQTSCAHGDGPSRRGRARAAPGRMKVERRLQLARDAPALRPTAEGPQNCRLNDGPSLTAVARHHRRERENSPRFPAA